MTGQAKVQLICMPYQNTSLSSLSIALLSSVLKCHGIETTESYLHFDFAKLIGQDVYFKIAEGGYKAAFTGEMLFAESRHHPIDDEQAQCQLETFFGNEAERAKKLRTYADHCLSQVAQAGATLIGFTTSNSQLMPSLWLAHQIKENWPDVRIVLGGSACSLPMGARIKEYYPEVDYVVSGFGEKPLLELAMGSACEDAGLVLNVERVDLNTLPIPDYEPFMQASRAFENDPNHLRIAFESSRGCWWGEKSHCTFCGLNQLEMAFNSKSSARVAQEIRTLWDRYQTNLFATDTILARNHIKEVLPVLAEYEDKPTIFYEVKANMTSQEVQLLRKANITWIQPGIESLSTLLLRHLDKGVTAIQNIALLKWCREQQIRISWNLLCGIPGETMEEYEAQIALMELIPHLCPPMNVIPIRIDRYSPYFDRYAEYGWSALRPDAEYQLLHPHMDENALYDVAYSFQALGGNLSVGAYLGTLQAAVERWQSRYAEQQDGLFWDNQNGLVKIECGEATIVRGGPTLAAVIRHSHDIVGINKLMAATGCSAKFIESLLAQGFLYCEGNRLINLAVRIGG